MGVVLDGAFFVVSFVHSWYRLSGGVCSVACWLAGTYFSTTSAPVTHFFRLFSLFVVLHIAAP